MCEALEIQLVKESASLPQGFPWEGSLEFGRALVGVCRGRAAQLL